MSESNAGHTSVDTIELVREGMVVNGPDGRPIGTVKLIRMGDPAAASDRASHLTGGSFLDGIAGAFGAHDEPNVPGELRDELLRVGFVKVGSLGPRPRNWYARSDQLALVARERLTLRVPPDDLIDELED